MQMLFPGGEFMQMSKTHVENAGPLCNATAVKLAHKKQKKNYSFILYSQGEESSKTFNFFFMVRHSKPSKGMFGKLRSVNVNKNRLF